MDMTAIAVQRRLHLCELAELRLLSYENAKTHNERTKQWYDKQIKQKEVIPG